MSQNDFNIANQGFPSFRSDLNGALQALASNSAGTTAPSTTYAYQWWYDETNELLKMRNSDNDAWITIGTFDQAADTFTAVDATVDKIEEGNSSVEVVDTGTGYVAITVDGAEAARVDANGRLGIGTTSPTTELEVAGTGDGSGAVVTIADAGSIGLEIQSNNPTLLFRENDTTDQNYQLRLQGGSLTFQTQNDTRSSASEVMRIDSSGRLLVGTTSNVGSSNPILSLSQSGGSNIAMERETTSSVIQVQFMNPNGVVGNIRTSASSTIYETSSDYRLKENVVSLTGAADRLAQIPVHRFNFIADPDITVDGFLAHEVQSIVPEAVSGEKDGMRTEQYEVEPALGEIYTPAQPATYDAEGVELTPATDEVIHSTNVERPAELLDGQQWRETTPAVMGEREVPDYQGIDQSKLVPLLTAALQEALQKIDALEARVTALGG